MVIPSLEGLPTKAKEAPSPHRVRLTPLDTNPVFHSLGDKLILAWRNLNNQKSSIRLWENDRNAKRKQK